MGCGLSFSVRGVLERGALGRGASEHGSCLCGGLWTELLRPRRSGGAAEALGVGMEETGKRTGTVSPLGVQCMKSERTRVWLTGPVCVCNGCVGVCASGHGLCRRDGVRLHGGGCALVVPWRKVVRE